MAPPPSDKKKTSTSKRKARSSGAKRTSSKKPSNPKRARKGGASKGRSASKAKAKNRAKKHKVVTSTAAPPRRWARWLTLEVAVVACGVLLGLLVLAVVLSSRAERDVQAWIDRPPSSKPLLVLSAPVEIEVGQPVDLADLAADLLASGFEKVGQSPEENQFQIDGRTLTVNVKGSGGLGGSPKGVYKITLVEGRVAATEPEDVILPPTLLARLGELDRDRSRLPLDQTGPYVGLAVMAMEDARFRTHLGLDLRGIVRASARNLTRGGPMHGGSTLTQQLAKNLFLTPDRTIRRKVREVFGAWALERRFSKDELLEIYLNEVYLGQVGGVPIHGVEQAARAWYGRSAANLTLGQAAVIAGVISAPNAYSPARHPERARQRASLTLERLEALGWVSADEIRAARSESLELRGVVTGGVRLAPWAVDAAMEQAERSLGEDLASGGYRVHTTIQPHLQRAATRAIREGLDEVQGAHPSAIEAQAALVAIRARDGAVVALVGGRDYRQSPFDRATHGLREIGSTIKPLTLAAVLDHDRQLHAQSQVVDEPITRMIDGKPWTPRNYDGKYLGEISLRQTLEQSRNVPAVKMAEHIGPQQLQRVLRDLGLERATNLPSASLGGFSATPLQLAGAYTSLAGGGDVSRPWPIAGISTPRGEQIVAYPPRTEPIFSARATAITASVLRGGITHGTARRAQALGVEGEVGAKTGTTNEGRDAWVAGVTPGYAIVVWVGRDQGPPLGLGGSQAALPIWARFAAHGGLRGGRFHLPEGMITEPFCRDSGRRARDACPDKVDELFVKGGAPRGKCDVHGGPLVESTSWIRRVLSPKKPADIQGDGVEGELAGESSRAGVGSSPP
ncbi:MAG: hypothetical protein EA397_10940 [Deltaproteobacteria bacterium]|nr:MAG: hypothetical protein EA397_10940 [Deltaproteobacteria bacterium]